MKLFFTTPIFPYPLNRPLTPFNKENQIFQKKPSPCPPWYELSVIKMNSTFLECPDKWFAEKGTISGPMLIIIVAFLAVMLAFPIILLIQWNGTLVENRIGAIFATLFVIFASSGVLWIGSFFFKKEMFRYTHYPVRFNRKTRKVYRFRDDGTIMVADWDKLFFYKGAVHGISGQISLAEVRCHHLAEDGETVLDTFALPSHSVPNDPFLLAQWEFVRHYMEVGPDDLVKNVPIVQDIADRREGFWAGFQTLQASAAGSYALLALLNVPFSLFYAVGRWVAMRTCKIPVWPAEIEAECQIEPNDPFIRDRDHLADPDLIEIPEGSHAKLVQQRKARRLG